MAAVFVVESPFFEVFVSAVPPFIEVFVFAIDPLLLDGFEVLTLVRKLGVTRLLDFGVACIGLGASSDDGKTEFREGLTRGSVAVCEVVDIEIRLLSTWVAVELVVFFGLAG